MLYAVQKEFRKHFLDYLLLVTVGLFVVACMMLFTGERFIQFGFIFGYAVFYLLWAFFHHYLDGSLKLRNMLEYILIALIVLFSFKLLIAP